MVTAAVPPQSCEFTLQVIDLTQGWSNAVADRITHTDQLAMAAVAYIHGKLRYTPGQEVPSQFTSSARSLYCTTLTEEPSCRADTPR